MPVLASITAYAIVFNLEVLRLRIRKPLFDPVCLLPSAELCRFSPRPRSAPPRREQTSAACTDQSHCYCCVKSPHLG